MITDTCYLMKSSASFMTSCFRSVNSLVYDSCIEADFLLAVLLVSCSLIWLSQLSFLAAFGFIRIFIFGLNFLFGPILEPVGSTRLFSILSARLEGLNYLHYEGKSPAILLGVGLIMGTTWELPGFS